MSVSAPVRVVIADDQTVVREGLRAMLGYQDGVEVADAVGCAEDALEAVRAHDPDVLLTDLRMPGLGGIEGIRRLRRSGSRTQAVALTTYDDDATIRDAIDAGALGFLDKDASPTLIVEAVQAAALGRALLDARVLRALTAAVGGAPGSAAREHEPAGLTPREGEVLRLVARGCSNQQVARALVISVATVKTHINHLLAKTQSGSRADLVRFAYDHGLTE